MIGKKLVAIAAVVAAGISFPAWAGDLGGNCCADLEERIAELETTTARKGNRKMSVTLYGQVNMAVVHHDVDAGPGFASRLIGDGSQSPSVFGFTGTAKVNPNTSMGFKFEFGVDPNRASISLLGLNTDPIELRHAVVWLEHSGMGRVSLGHTSTATDGIVEISVANTAVAAKMLDLEPVNSRFLFGLVNLPFDGGRRDIIRYDSASLGGLQVSASYGNGDQIGPLAILGEGDVWDVAVRYAGEFSGFRVAAGVGFRNEDHNTLGPLAFATAKSSLSGSASIMHTGSGLFASGAAGRVTDFGGPASGVDLTGMHGQAGWEKNVTGLGSTTLYGEYAKLDITGAGDDINMMGVGLVQAIDAAAADVYVNWRGFDLGGGSDQVNVFMGGVRIRF